MTKDISEKILQAIKDKEIKPIPKWAFLLKDSLLWSISIVTLVVGGCAFAVIIFSLKTNDWDLYSRASGSLPGFVLATLPYFWVFIFAFLVFVAYYNFRHSKGGYRYNFLAVVVVSLAASLVFGGILSVTNFGKELERVFGENFPLYRQFNFNREKIWLQPEQGLLAGEIVEVVESGDFSLTDFNDRLWQVLANDAKKRGVDNIKQGIVIKIIGDRLDDNSFRALEIRPWQGMSGLGCRGRAANERNNCPMRSR